MPSLIGNKPNQVPTNGDLGDLAFQDSNAVKSLTVDTQAVTNQTVTNSTVTTQTVRNPQIDTEISDIRPSLLLDFAKSKTLDPRITFTRATTATFYDGKTVAKAEENLLLQSQAFETANWSNTATTETANTAIAPDGTTTADTLIEDSATNTHRIRQLVAVSGVVTLSVFAKTGSGSRFLTIGCNKGAGDFASATFDITNGTVTQTLVLGTYSSQSASISQVGTFYRCSLTVTTDSVTEVLIGLSATSTFSNATRGFDSYTGDNTSSLILWGAQLEQRSSVTAYTPTTTAPITNYIPALQTAAVNTPRFEHNPITGESLGLEIEEQRTNLLTYSEDLNTEWSNGNAASWQYSSAVSPAGTITALGVDGLSGTGLSISGTTLYKTGITASGSTTYTFSVFVRAKTGTYSNVILRLNETNGNNNVSSAFTVNETWQRISITVTTASTATALSTLVGTTPGTANLFIWGAQLEAGAFPTSYIPTVASQVTRNADSASMTGANFSSWYRADEGTLYGEFNGIPELTAAQQVFKVWDGTNNNRTQISLVGSSAFFVRMVGGGAIQANLGGTPTANTAYKIAGAYKTNDTSVSISGASALTDTACIIPVVNQAVIASNSGTIKKIAYYPKRLSNAELQEMTL